MSETKTDENAGREIHGSPAENADVTTSSAAGGAVDTGRRIDPALLKGGGAAQPRTIRRRPAGAEDAPTSELVALPGARSEAPAPRDDRGPPSEAPPREGPPRDGPPGDGRGPPRGDRGPPREGQPGDGRGPPRGDRGNDRGPPRNDRGPPRRDGGRPGGRDDKRGPRSPAPDQRRSAGARSEGPAEIHRAPTAPEDVGDFAAMLAASGPIDHMRVIVGDRVKAKVVHMSKDTVFFQLSGTQEAFMPTAELLDEDGLVTVKVGDTVESFVTSLSEGILLSRKLGRGEVDVGLLEQARNTGIPIDGTVTAVNKGGVEVSLAGTRGFCPTGQLDINFIEDTASLIGKSLSFLIKEVKEGGKNLVLSRKALLERDRKEKSAKLLATLAPGQVLPGTVTRIQPFGVFVDLGGIDGLVPMSELSYGRVAEASEVVQIGEQVQVEVLRIEENPKRQGELRIALSLKATLPDPFVAHQGELNPGNTVEGRVVRLEAFGAFVEIFPGVQGLIHVSELADKRIRHPEDLLKLDDRVKVRVLDFDLVARRVSLSLREPGDAVTEPNAGEAEPARGAPRGPRRGAQVEGTVDRIERYGVFVQLDGGGSAFLPASESGTPKGSDVGKALPIGTRMSLLVIEVDERGRVKVSKVAREMAEERALVDQYKSTSAAAGFGTFADLLKKKAGK